MPKMVCLKKNDIQQNDIMQLGVFDERSLKQNRYYVPLCLAMSNINLSAKATGHYHQCIV